MTDEPTSSHPGGNGGAVSDEDRAIAARLGQLQAAVGEQCADAQHPVPARAEVERIVEDLRAVLFPGYFGESFADAAAQQRSTETTLARVRRTLRAQAQRALCFGCSDASSDRCRECEARTEFVTRAFLGRLPAIRQLLAADVEAAYTGDPAASSPSETILSYPGIRAMTSYRIAHELHALGVPLVPRMITEYAHSATGIDIHPGTRIGSHFFIDHGTGVVIGETAVIGSRVRIYQGVTLGARSFPLDDHGHPIKGIPRHPIIEDDVIIYSGATILGRVTIGAGSVIGGNVWLTHDVPPGSRISQVEAS